MYILIAGGGKVGANLTRSVLDLGHEVTLIEQRRERFETLEEEFEHRVQVHHEQNPVGRERNILWKIKIRSAADAPGIRWVRRII